MVSRAGSAATFLEAGGNSTFGCTGAFAAGRGTGASEGSGTLGAAEDDAGDGTGAGLDSASFGFEGRATEEVAAAPLAKTGTGRAWPATSRAASSSFATATREA